jgi:hypothetical protein
MLRSLRFKSRAEERTIVDLLFPLSRRAYHVIPALADTLTTFDFGIAIVDTQTFKVIDFKRLDPNTMRKYENKPSLISHDKKNNRASLYTMFANGMLSPLDGIRFGG